MSPEDMPEEVIARFRDAMVSFMFLPGERATFLACELATDGHIDEQTVLTVLNSYAQAFDDAVPAGQGADERVPARCAP